MRDVYIVLLFFLTPILGFFCFALFAPFFYIMFPKHDDGAEADNGAFHASMYQSMGDP